MNFDQLEVGLGNLEFIESLYQQYRRQPTSVDSSWRRYFESFESPKLAPSKKQVVENQDYRLLQLIEAYRQYGHLAAPLNPIALGEKEEPIQLKLETWGFQQSDLNRTFSTHGLLTKQEASLQEIIQVLKDLYSQRIGFEYKGFTNPELERWLQERLDSSLFDQPLSIEQKRLILDYLSRSEIFESFLHTKYVGQKRFSLEGAETLIPMLALLIEKGAEHHLKEIVLGMAHRGRLNVLSNILNKSYQEIFSEFDEGYIPESFEGTGDVKYHKGYASDVVITENGKIVKVTLTPNPSHLESVDPVVEGQARAKQFLEGDEPERKKIVPILIHGDAALSGQGIVYETLQLYQLPGYTTGGTLHFVINNQIGFTTIPRDARSTTYCTDIARAFGAPVFHVNAEDPEACVIATLLAFEIRQRFHCDVFIDLNGYRKYGHNESDEPFFTQPLEYQLIRKKKPIREIYRDQLIHQGVLEKKIAESLEEEFRKKLQEAHTQLQQKQPKASTHSDLMEVPNNDLLFNPVSTGVPKQTLVEMTRAFSTIPNHFSLHAKLVNLVKERLNMVQDGKPIDWGMAEYLTYASLVWQGIPVRLSGQDSGRGTFSHRHALWVDQVVEQEYVPLAKLKEGQGRFEIINSPLSEMAVVGFEYGYSVACPQGLTIWEAQFGDFSNGAQVIIDQYIASGEQKWGQKSGLTLFLPHGYEGQGPEHSSGRLERFLSLAGHDNIQVVYPTTPAQLFHVLRRQVMRSWRKPLILFTPKGLLRHPACVNRLEDFVEGSFQEILDDPLLPAQVRKLIFCTGRMYYDLSAQRDKLGIKDMAIIRIEQLYPLHQHRLAELIHQYSTFQECLWVQEEPQNMGAWHFIRPYLENVLPHDKPLHYVGRLTSASPATGIHSKHKQEHDHILKQVFEQ